MVEELLELHGGFAAFMKEQIRLPLACAASSASAISIPNSNTSSSGSGLPEMRCFNVAPAIFGDFVDGANVRVIQGRCGFSFTLETHQSLRVLGFVVWKEFESDKAIEFDVLSFVHHAHPAASELFENAVMRDDLPIE
jgi:hypothetical protein